MKFNYKQRVSVVEGFYKGRSGIIYDYITYPSWPWKKAKLCYYVLIDNSSELIKLFEENTLAIYEDLSKRS